MSQGCCSIEHWPYIRVIRAIHSEFVSGCSAFRPQSKFCNRISKILRFLLRASRDFCGESLSSGTVFSLWSVLVSMVRTDTRSLSLNKKRGNCKRIFPDLHQELRYSVRKLTLNLFFTFCCPFL